MRAIETPTTHGFLRAAAAWSIGFCLLVWGKSYTAIYLTIETAMMNRYGLPLSGWLCFSACSWPWLSSFNTAPVYRATDGEGMVQEVVVEAGVADGGLQGPRLHTTISSPGSQRMIGNHGDLVSGPVLWAVLLQDTQWGEAREEEEIMAFDLEVIMLHLDLRFLHRQEKALGLAVQGGADLSRINSSFMICRIEWEENSAPSTV